MSAGADMWENCGYEEDYLQAMLLPWEWVTGGYFSLIFVSILVVIPYIKYHNPIFPLTIGLLLLPVSYNQFPGQFTNVVFIIVGILIGVFLFTILLRKTKDYD